MIPDTCESPPRRETVAVIVPTYGDLKIWQPLADRALKSVEKQTRLPDQIIRFHDTNIRRARNLAARQVKSDWIIFLDADDELDPQYVEAMMAAKGGHLRQPASKRIHLDGTVTTPICKKPKPWLTGNYLVIGTMVQRKIFEEIGGFDDYAVSEDWAFWLKAKVLANVDIVQVPDAIYIIHERAGSRNSMKNAAVRQAIKDRFAHLANERGLSLR